MRDQNDSALVERLRGQDEHALAELSSLYGARIYQLAFRYMRNHEDAEEVVQDVLLKVFRKIELFRGDSALSSWVYRITFNTAMSRLRRTRLSRLAEVTELEIGTSIHEDGTGAFDPADWSQMADEAMLPPGAARTARRRGRRPARHLPRAGDPARPAGPVHRRGEHAAAGQGPDPEVAASPRQAAASRKARRLRRRPFNAQGGGSILGRFQMFHWFQRYQWHRSAAVPNVS